MNDLQGAGTAEYGRFIRQNIEQAYYLAGQIKAVPELELALSVCLNIVNFRNTRPGLNDDRPDDLNKTD